MNKNQMRYASHIKYWQAQRRYILRRFSIKDLWALKYFIALTLEQADSMLSDKMYLFRKSICV